jgi:hypothetical protein
MTLATGPQGGARPVAVWAEHPTFHARLVLRQNVRSAPNARVARLSRLARPIDGYGVADSLGGLAPN